MYDRVKRIVSLNPGGIIWPTLFYDDCEGLFHYEAGGDGAAHSEVYSNTHAYVGNHSVALITDTAAAAIGQSSYVDKRLWVTPSKRLSLTFCFFRANTISSYIRAFFYWYDGTNLNSAALQFTSADSSVAYLNSGATWTTLAGVSWNPTNGRYWTFVHLLIDLTLKQYITAQVNHQLSDLSSISFPVSANAAAAFFQLRLLIETRANDSARVNLDQIILRGDNP